MHLEGLQFKRAYNMMRHLIRFAIAVYYISIIYWFKINENNFLQAEDPLVIKMSSLYPRYISNWTFLLTTCYFVSCVMTDILQEISVYGKFEKCINDTKSYIFTVVIAPTTLEVNIVYWSVYFYNREFVYPEALDTVIPDWVNCTIHLSTSIAVFVEMFICKHQFLPYKNVFPVINLYYSIYMACFLGTYFQTNFWIYPVYKNLNWGVRITIIIFLNMALNCCYIITKYVNNLIRNRNSIINSIINQEQKGTLSTHNKQKTVK